MAKINAKKKKEKKIRKRSPSNEQRKKLKAPKDSGIKTRASAKKPPPVLVEKINGKWQCPFCQKQFNKIDSARQHSTKKHGQILTIKSNKNEVSCKKRATFDEEDALKFGVQSSRLKRQQLKVQVLEFLQKKT